MKALSTVFRAGLQRAFEQGDLTFAAATAPLAQPTQFAALLAQLQGTPWVVYAKQPFACPAQVIKYLGRYTHRIAISNARLVSLLDGVVRFRWKDYADHGHTKTMALDFNDFLHRFLLHVLPRGFVRIRHFGLLANPHRRATLARARQLLGAAMPTPSRTTTARPIPIGRTVRSAAADGGSWWTSCRGGPHRPSRSFASSRRPSGRADR